MSHELQIVKGSLLDASSITGKSLAETFIGCDYVVLLDVSGSMGAKDSRGDKSRYDVALEELAELQRNLPGRMAIVAFSGYAQFVPGGIPPFMAAGTNLGDALRFVKIADVGDIQFIVISDGRPDSESDALSVAATFQGKIDVIYVGPEAQPRGRDFLQRLAQASGGRIVTAGRVIGLAEKAQHLFLTN